MKHQVLWQPLRIRHKWTRSICFAENNVDFSSEFSKTGQDLTQLSHLIPIVIPVSPPPSRPDLLHLLTYLFTQCYCFQFALIRTSYNTSGNLFTVTGRMNCALSQASRKINKVHPKILPLFNNEEEWLLLTYYLSTCLSWCSVLKRCCTLTWISKILMQAIWNVHAGRRFSTSELHKCITLCSVFQKLNQDQDNYHMSKAEPYTCMTTTTRWWVSEIKSC